MTDNAPTRQAIAAQGRSGKLTVTGKLKVALDAMLFEAASRPDAASKAGMTDHSLRAALKKPHVKRYYSEGLEVIRTSERAKNLFALARVRDSSDNSMAVVAASKALEQLAEESDERRPTGAGPSMPGMVVRIMNVVQPAAPPTTIDIGPVAKPVAIGEREP